MIHLYLENTEGKHDLGKVMTNKRNWKFGLEKWGIKMEYLSNLLETYGYWSLVGLTAFIATISLAILKRKYITPPSYEV